MNDVAGVAQLVEPLTVDQVVAGSSPVSRPSHIFASVAQLDRALDFGSKGRGFKSFRAHRRALSGLFSFFFACSLIISLFVLTSSSLFAQTAQLHNTAGLAKFYQGKYEEAFAEFVTALRKDPSYAAPHYNLGRLYEKQQRFEEALKQYQQCIQLDPRHEGARTAVQRLGYLVAPPREEPAPSTVREARKADLDRQKRVIGRLIVDGKLDKAEERLLLLLRAHPKDGALHNALARVYERKGDFSRAITELRQSERYLPDSSIVVYRLAANLYRVGAFAEAEVKARRVIEMDPANYRAYHLLGLIYRSRDDLPQAQKYFAEAARLNPSDSNTQDELKKVSTNVGLYHFNAGLFYFTQRNWKRAKEELDIAIKKGNLNPGQLAIAQQYLLISDFSSQRIDVELARLESDRKNAERGFVAKRLTFDEVEKSPHIWRKGAYVKFEGLIVSVDRNRMGIICDTKLDSETQVLYKQESEMKSWFHVSLPKALPNDPRIDDGARIEVEGKLSKPRFLRNIYNKLYSREPQPVVEATYVTINSEIDLSGPLKLDYLAYSDEQVEQKTDGSQGTWRKYRYK